MFSDPNIVSALNSLKNYGVSFEEAIELICKIYGKTFVDARKLVEIQAEIEKVKFLAKSDKERANYLAQENERLKRADYFLKFIKKFGDRF